MGPTLALSASDGPHVGPMNHAISEVSLPRNLPKASHINSSIESLCTETAHDTTWHISWALQKYMSAHIDGFQQKSLSIAEHPKYTYWTNLNQLSLKIHINNLKRNAILTLHIQNSFQKSWRFLDNYQLVLMCPILSAFICDYEFAVAK